MDTMTIEVLPDGTLKVETGKVSGPNHLNAEQFINEMAKQAGGPVTRTKKGHSHHGHSHTHHEGEHQHH